MCVINYSEPSKFSMVSQNETVAEMTNNYHNHLLTSPWGIVVTEVFGLGILIFFSFGLMINMLLQMQ